MILLNNKQIKPTIFPDGTSQIWKIDESLLKEADHITWYFEKEEELIHLAQIKELLDCYSKKFITLFVPYFPYGRQDKQVNNNSTFAGKTFCKLLDSLNFFEIMTVDIHSDVLRFNLKNLYNIDINEFHLNTIQKIKPTYIVFPDEGASNRYRHLKEQPHIIFHKKRDQQTGEILGHYTKNSPILKSGDTFLIVDDICDGGATFISISKILHETKQNIGVNLCVTHGLFSKGREILYNSGINQIFTTTSLLRNHGQENVFEV